jgi:hypothetical protein
VRNGLLTRLCMGCVALSMLVSANAAGAEPATIPPPEVTPPDPGPPALTVTGVPQRIRLERLLADGLSFRESANERVAFTDGLLMRAHEGLVGSGFDPIVARCALPLGAPHRQVTLMPSRKLLGRARRLRLALVLTATDAGGNYTTTTRTIDVR